MKKFFNDPVLVILIIACIIVLAINISAEAKAKEFRNDCGRFKVKNNGEFVTYADSAFELKGGVIYLYPWRKKLLEGHAAAPQPAPAPVAAPVRPAKPQVAARHH
jgi:hypothetical protein